MSEQTAIMPRYMVSIYEPEGASGELVFTGDHGDEAKCRVTTNGRLASRSKPYGPPPVSVGFLAAVSPLRSLGV